MALVRRMRKLFLVVLVALAVGGCKGDPSKPEYWEKAISGAKNSALPALAAALIVFA